MRSQVECILLCVESKQFLFSYARDTCNIIPAKELSNCTGEENYEIDEVHSRVERMSNVLISLAESKIII